MDDTSILLMIALIAFVFGFVPGFIWCMLEKKGQIADAERFIEQSRFIKH